MRRDARRAQLQELAHRTARDAHAVAALHAQLAAPALAPAPPAEDADLTRIRAAISRSREQLDAIRADIERTAATREATMPAERARTAK